MNRKGKSRRDFLKLSAIGAAGMLTACTAEKLVPQIVKETVVVGGTPQIVEKAITSTPKPAPKIITWLEMWSDAWDDFGPLADKWQNDFIAMHPEENFVIDRRIFAADANWEDVVMNAVNAGNLEDFALVNPYMIPAMVDKVPLATVDDIFEAAGGKDQFTFGHPWRGHEYMMSMYGSALVPWVNMTMLKDAGLDGYAKTWDEHLTHGAKVTDATKQRYWNTIMLCGSGGGHLVWAMFLPWLAQTGKPAVDDQNNLIINSEGGVQVLEFWKQMDNAGVLTPGSITNCGNFGLQTFGSGNTAWIGMEGSYMISHFKAQEVDFEVQPALVSAGPGGSKGMAMATGLAMNAKAPNLDLAKKFLQYLTTGEASYELCIAKKMLTPYKPIIERVVKEVPEAQVIANQGEIGLVDFPVFGAWYDSLGIFSLYCGQFWNGEITAKEAVDKIVEDWNLAVKRV